MVEGFGLIVILIIAIVFIIVATSKLNIHAFIVLLFASYLVAAMAGMPANKIGQTISQGFGNILMHIGIVIIMGTIIGVILERSGAAIKMADVLLKITGKKHPALVLSLIGYIISIPVFCDSAYVILSSLKRSLIKKSGISAVTMSIALASGLYASHTLIPPTPGPIAAAGNLGLTDQLGLVILFGLGISLITMFTGYLWACYTGKKHQSGEDITLDIPDEKKQSLPSAFNAFSPILIPIILISLGSVVNVWYDANDQSVFGNIISFLGKPLNALVIGFLFSLALLPAFNKETLNGWIGDGIKSAANIIMITGAGGAFGSILEATQIGEYIGSSLSEYHLGLILPFIIAAALKSAQGSSTVAIVTASALIAPMIPSLGLDYTTGRVLTVMAVGAGAMTVSHANDSYFWVVTQFSKMDVATGYKTMTIATLLQGIVTMGVILIISLFV